MLEYPFAITHTWSGAQERNLIDMLIHRLTKMSTLKNSRLQLTKLPYGVTVKGGTVLCCAIGSAIS